MRSTIIKLNSRFTTVYLLTMVVSNIFFERPNIVCTSENNLKIYK